MKFLEQQQIKLLRITFLLFLGEVMNANEFETKEKYISLQHIHPASGISVNLQWFPEDRIVISMLVSEMSN